MNPSYEAELIQRRMEELRYELDTNVEQVIETARARADWRYYLNAYPWAFMGAAFVVGYLVVPRRINVPVYKPDPRDLLDLARREGLVLTTPEAAPADATKAAVKKAGGGNTIMNSLMSMATRSLMSYGMQMLSNHFLQPPPHPHHSNGHHEPPEPTRDN